MMTLMEMLGAKAQEIARRDQLDEVEQLAYIERNGSLHIYARTEGKLTRETFGVPWHIGCACIRLRHAEPLLDACIDRLEVAEIDHHERTRLKGGTPQSTNHVLRVEPISHRLPACKVGAPGHKNLARVLRSLFLDSEMHLSDLLDLLDRHGIPYSYRSISSYGALFRAEESAS